MSVVTGPDIVETNLVLSYDAMNIRSYPGSGSTWFDVSGYDNHGSINGGEYSNGWLQNSGNTSGFFYIITGNTGSLYNTFSTTSGGWSIEESVYTYSTNYPEADAGTVISDNAYSPGGTGFDWQHGVGVTQFQMGMSSNSGGSYEDQSTFTVPSPYNQTNVWRLRTMVWNRGSNTFSFYINGNLVGSASTPNTAGTSVYDGGGCSWGTLYGWKFFGRRSTIKVYSIALSATQVSTNWNAWQGRYGVMV
jgi:hypothetical protein